MTNLDISLAYYLRMYINEIHDSINSENYTDTNKHELREAIKVFEVALDHIDIVQEILCP